MEPRLLWDGFKTKKILLHHVHMMANRHPAWSFLPEISVDFAINHDFCRGLFLFSGMQQIYIMLKNKAEKSSIFSHLFNYSDLEGRSTSFLLDLIGRNQFFNVGVELNLMLGLMEKEASK